MNCRRVVNLMSAYVDGELAGVEMLEIRRHLSDCKECAEEWEATLFTKQALARLASVTPREGFVTSLMGTLEVVEVPSYQRAINHAFQLLHKKFTPVAAALAASGLALVIMSAGGVDGISTAQSDMMAAAPFTQLTGASFVPVVHNDPASIASERPLRVASDRDYLHSQNMELVSLVEFK
jgi:anti-sigma factor RsiW